MDKKFIPMDLSDIDFPEGYEKIREEIAEEIHKRWAYERINQGWTYGEYRNEKEKVTNCLVAYDELPEEEKRYDRNTAETAIKVLIKNGYEIKKKGCID